MERCSTRLCVPCRVRSKSGVPSAFMAARVALAEPVVCRRAVRRERAVGKTAVLFSETGGPED
jgi:hypothetical protein